MRAIETIFSYFSASVYFSIWYMSPSNLEIGTLPIVSLKNSDSIMKGLIARSDGNNNNSLPNRVGCRGYLNRTWSDRMLCKKNN